MSLINQMLKDLDARAAGPGAAPMPEQVRVVVGQVARPRWQRAAMVGVPLALLGIGAAALWLFQPRGAAPEPDVRAPVVIRPQPSADAAPAAPAVQPAPAQQAAPLDPAMEPAPVALPAPAAPVPAARLTATPAAVKPAVKAAPTPVPAALAESGAGQGRTETPEQRIENGYRRSLVLLADGRMTEAIASLQAVLRAEPRHEASRQTLVGLLVEAGRTEEAMQQLQTALALDPRQPPMALLLARLQLEHGGPALDTLMRTLPHASGNGDYHAFLGAVLQRQERYREAAEQYQAALATAPDNGVWWMGLGMALQAQMRAHDAAAAYARALQDAALTPQLRAFVERRQRQLGQ